MAEFYHFDEDGRLTAEGPDGWSPPAGGAGRWERIPTADDLLVFHRPEGRGEAAGPRAVLAGDLQGFHVVELLGYLAQSRWTGAVLVESGAQRRRLWIRRGRLVRAESNGYAHRLGQVLRALRLVDRDVLDQELASGASDGEPLGRRLVADGVLSSEGLATAVQRRLEEVFYDLLERERGLFFLFNEPTEAEEEDPELDLNFLLMEGLRRIDETRRFREVIPHDAVWVVRADAAAPDDPDQRALWEHVGDGIEWARLREDLGLFEFDLAERVVAAVQAGRLEVREEPPPPGGATGAAWEMARRMDALLAEVFDALPVEARPEVAEAVDWFLSDGDHGQEAVLQGLSLREDGSLPVGDLVANLEAAGGEAQDALEELTFFLLMQAGRHLGYKANQRLSRRVQAALKRAAGPAAEPTDAPPGGDPGPDGREAELDPFGMMEPAPEAPARRRPNGHGGNGAAGLEARAGEAEPDPFPDLSGSVPDAPTTDGGAGAGEATDLEEDASDEALIHAAFEARMRPEAARAQPDEAEGEPARGGDEAREEEDTAPGATAPPPEESDAPPEEAPPPASPESRRPAWRWPEPGERAEPQEPAGGLLEVESDPPGAWVYLDGHRLGRTPLSHLKPQGAGAHKLEVRMAGWKIWSRTVMLAGSAPSRFEVQLHRAEVPAQP